MKKIITLLGSTGSIGTQTLDVVRMHGLEVYALAAYHNVSLRPRARSWLSRDSVT